MSYLHPERSLDPPEPRRDPAYYNPPCIACGDEIGDGDLLLKIDGSYYCNVCWANPGCVKCEKPICDETPVEVKMLCVRTGKFDPWHFHAACHADWQSTEGGDYEPCGEGLKERVTQ